MDEAAENVDEPGTVIWLKKKVGESDRQPEKGSQELLRLEAATAADVAELAWLVRRGWRELPGFTLPRQEAAAAMEKARLEAELAVAAASTAAVAATEARSLAREARQEGEAKVAAAAAARLEAGARLEAEAAAQE